VTSLNVGDRTHVGVAYREARSSAAGTGGGKCSQGIDTDKHGESVAEIAANGDERNDAREHARQATPPFLE
jgi:hypothetical protein